MWIIKFSCTDFYYLLFIYGSEWKCFKKKPFIKPVIGEVGMIPPWGNSMRQLCPYSLPLVSSQLRFQTLKNHHFVSSLTALELYNCHFSIYHATVALAYLFKHEITQHKIDTFLFYNYMLALSSKQTHWIEKILVGINIPNCAFRVG